MQVQYITPLSNIHKIKKSCSKHLIKQSLLKLYQIYSSIHITTSLYQLYLQVLDLTTIICINQVNCGKDVVQICDILNNNVILGMKIKSVQMVAGFAFVIIKFVNQGLDSLAYYINMIKNMANQQSKQPQNPPIPPQLALVLKNIKSLIFLNISSISQKIQALVERTLGNLSKIMQWNELKINRLDDNGEFNVEEHFFHSCLKLLKICKLNRKYSCYKEVLANYFQYVDIYKLVPMLDICKLTLDAISINQQYLNQENINCQQQISKHDKNVIIYKNDEEITGFIIRKCFYLLRQCYNKNGFFIIDIVLNQTVNKCLVVLPYCKNYKTIIGIFQCLVAINKLSLVTNQYQWNQIGEELDKQNIKNIVKNNYNDKQINMIKVCKFVSSLHLFILYIINNLSLFHNENKILQQKEFLSLIPKLKKYIKKILSIFIIFSQHQLMNIWNHIINNLNVIKQQVIKKFQRKYTLIYRNWILDWSFCAQIQQNIITNSQHKKASDNLYKKLEKSNLYILIGRQYLLTQETTFTNKFTNDQLPPTPSNTQIVRLCRQVDKLVDQQKMFVYWDQLLSIGASLWQISVDIRSIMRITSILKQLIKCKNMILFAHGHQHKDPNIKYYKMNGLYNLLISFIKINQFNIQDKQQQQKFTCQLNQQYHNENNKRNKKMEEFKVVKQKSKSEIVVEIFKEFMPFIMQTSIYTSSHENQLITCQNSTSSAENHRSSTPPYYELFAYSIAIVPLIQSKLTLQHRSLVVSLINKISQTNDKLLLNNIRHIYHKTIANLLQDYMYIISNNKTNYNDKNQNNSKSEKQIIFKKKIVLTNYLQFYGSLYPNNRQIQTIRQSSQLINKDDHICTNNIVVKKLNYRRSSVYMREALQQHIQPFQAMNTKQQQKSPKTQIQTAYQKILFIDFMYWVIHYCNIKQLIEIENLTRDILEQWLNGKILQEFLVNAIKMCKNNIIHNFYKNNGGGQCVELMTQCCNKLLYLSCRSATSKIIANGKKSQKGYADNRVRQDKSDQQQCNSSTTTNCIGYQKINIEFEIQQASIHIERINMLLVPFTKLIQQSMLKNINQKNMINQFMELNWNNIVNSNVYNDQYLIKNPNRLITCLNNLIGFAYNIGHHYYGQPKNNNMTSNNNVNETHVLNILCTFKLMIINKIYGVWMCYHAFAQMVFMGYMPKIEYKIHEIQQNINKYQQQLCKQNQYDNTKMNNLKDKKDKKDKDGASFQSNLILITKLYLSLLTQQNQHQLLSLMSTNYQNFNTCLKITHLLQNIVHLHPHKPVMRTISGYIWTRNCLNQAALLKYQQPILPITYSAMQNINNKVNVEGRIKAVWQYSSSQMQHSLLSLTMTRLLECLIVHGQVSEFRSILKFSMIYFVRSRNIMGILLALRSYFTRTKYINFSSIASNNFSQNQPINNHHHPLSEHLSKLDMLSICDSMISIFSVLHPLLFNKKIFDKYCKLVLGVGNRRRTSISFYVSMENIMNILSQSLGCCGKKGIQLVRVLGEYACKVLGLRQEYIVYKRYSQLINTYNYQHQPNLQIKEIKDYKLNQHFSKRFLQFCTQIQLKYQNTSAINSQQLQHCFIQQIRNSIPFSYYYASIIQNMLSNIIPQVLQDNIILQLSILLLDHNYTYKKMIQNIQPLGLNPHIDNNYLQNIQQSNQKYRIFIDQYFIKHMRKLEFLLSSQLKYPLNIIYPLGDRVYTLAIKQPLLVLHIDRGQFDDYMNTVDTLIANNSRLLNNKTIDHKQWWKSRDRVDRSISKIVNEINIPLWDIQIRQNNYTRTLTTKQLKIYKLISNVIQCYGNDIKKIKDVIKYSNISINDDEIDLFIIKINQVRNIQQFCNKYQENYNQNLILFIHHSYIIFPFQANKYLRQRAIYRIPSIQYLIEQNTKGLVCKHININQLNYLINTGNDLPETQKSFYKIKQNYPSWYGIIGKKPTFKEYFQLLQLQCFLFMGHGVGCQHIKDKEFYGKSVNSLIMLFGCNSASITQGKCQSNGIAHSHLLNGAPGLLGCLWQVTDKDTDKMTQNIFKTISSQPQNLAKIVSLAKKKCKHQCLNGGAIVLFGIPIYVHVN